MASALIPDSENELSWDTITENHVAVEEQILSQDITEKKKIGKGAFGTVYSGVLGKNRKVAIKEFSVEPSSKTCQRETALIKRFDHPNVVKFYGFIENPLSIVMELGETDLHSVMYSGFLYKYQDAIRWMIQCANGVKYLHESNVVHRDLKPHNLLLFAGKSILKVCDFGLSRVLSVEMSSETGTPRYIAPEVLKKTNYDAKCDVFSFAVVFNEVLTRKTPYSDYSTLVSAPPLIYAIGIGKRPKINELTTPKCIVSLLTSCWETDPSNRQSIAEVLQFLLMLNDEDELLQVDIFPPEEYSSLAE